MKHSLIIEPCGADDIEAVGQFYDNEILYMNNHGVNYPKWQYGQYPSARSAAAATENGTQYLCRQHGQIVGAFVLDEQPNGAYERGNWTANLQTGQYLVIHALAVSHKMAGRGIGSAAVQYCIKYAQSAGYKAVRIDVVPSNLPARRLYEKLGFTCAGEKDLDRHIPDIPTFALYELQIESIDLGSKKQPAD